MLESKGLAIRAVQYETLIGELEHKRIVAIWHLPHHIHRDLKLIAALAYIDTVKRQQPMGMTPKRLIKSTMFDPIVDNDWLYKPLVDWLSGKWVLIQMPQWVSNNNSGAVTS